MEDERKNPMIYFEIENRVDTYNLIFNAVVVELNVFWHRKEYCKNDENYIEIQNNSIDKMKNLLEELKIKY